MSYVTKRSKHVGSIQIGQALCMDRKTAPICEVCRESKATAATMEPGDGIVTNVCPDCQDESLTVVAMYI